MTQIGVRCEDGAWLVTVIQGGLLQQFTCLCENSARRFAALFERPPRPARQRAAPRRRTVTVPSLRVSSVRWG